MRLSVLTIAGAAVVLGLAPALARAQEPPRSPAQDAARTPQDLAGLFVGGEADFDPNQPIKPGFQLSVRVSSGAGEEAELTGVFPVDPTGNIQMKLIGLVQVRQLTPSQAADKIAALLKPYLKDPTVSVAIVSVPRPVVFLSGSVARSGAVPVADGTTLAELLTVMGFTDNADLSKVRVVRRGEKNERTMTEYDFLRWLKPAPGAKPDETQNPALGDRDFVFVPLKTVPSTGNVSVMGDVQRPGIVPLRSGVPLTLREAMTLSGGLNPTADRGEVVIRRSGIDKPIVVDYDRAQAGDAASDILMLPDDVVFVQQLGPEQYVTMNGAVVRPGRLPYTGPMTLTQAIADAGGIQLSAKDQEGRVFRHVAGPDPTKTQIIAFNYRKIRTNKEPDMLLEAGDTVEIPQGYAPRPALDPLQLTQSLLSIALTLDLLMGGRRY
ncbi:MAG: SLBB domain-containing protein [Chthonomonadales bacterium]|nr:SLBB domain-containing protein [Chthonomonadales bacterium]